MAGMPLAGTEFAGYRLVWVAGKGDVSTLFLAEDGRGARPADRALSRASARH
jgi:hypothetical protein